MRPRPARSAAATGRLSIVVILFLVGLVFPLFIYLGPLRLSPYRIVLLLCLIPSLFRWLSGGAGPIRPVDVCIILIGLWGVLSWAVLHGAAVAVESGGIHIVETLGAYFLGRCFIRSPEAFHRMAMLLFWIVIGLLPFLLYEILTGRSMILESISALGSTYGNSGAEPRLGLERAQGPFQHPILLGVFCGAVVSLAYYVASHGRRLVTRALRVSAVVFASFCALSSGPLAGIAVQLLLIGWDRVFRRYQNRWWALGGLAALGYVVVDLISNRTPLKVMMSYLTFNPGTAHARITQFEWGWKDVMKHPVFGNALNVLGEWERPEWITSGSIDIFWLQRTMQHGLPMGALYLLAFFLIFLAVARRRLSDPRLRDYRMGYLGSMAGMFFAGWSVHFWNEPYVLLMFLMGSGVWLLDHDETPPAKPPSARPKRRRTVLG
jgi:hypothetical protein